MAKASPDQTAAAIERFKKFVVKQGGELLVPTNEYEMARFRGNGITSIVYQNAKGRRTYVGEARAAWDAFVAGDTSYRLTKIEPRPKLPRDERDTITRTLIERDGNICFYCGAPFLDGFDPTRSKEHLVARTHGGPDHISNMFLACKPCNDEADHMSAPEKIRLRDRKRRGVGSKLLNEIFQMDDCPKGARAKIADFLLPQPKDTER